jgi:hypothetical protein
MNNALVGFDKSSAAYVILHSILRKRRGKQPSMSYLGEKNPQKALKMAIEDCRRELGDHMIKGILAVEAQNDRSNWKKQHKHSLGRENPHCEDCGKPVSEWLLGEECIPST